MLTETGRFTYYESLLLTQQQISLIERTRSDSPARKVGQGALNNSVMALHSLINNERRDLESMTVEGAHALELELSPDVHEYYAQTRIYGVERWVDGKRYVSPATLDKMVFRSGKIVFVECKDLSKVTKLAARHPGDWCEVDGQWTHAPYQTWAREHGFEFELWTPPSIPGIYLANLLLLYNFKCEQLLPSDERAAERLKRHLDYAPLTISEATSAVSGINPRLISMLLAQKQIYGTLKSCQLNNLENFTLCNDESRATEIDAFLLKQLDAGFQQPLITDPILSASKTDYEMGKRRLGQVELMRTGKIPTTRRYVPLIRAVEKAHLEGSSPLAPCITKYAKCGSTDSKLDPDLPGFMEQFFKEFWDTGIDRKKIDLHTRLVKLASESGFDAPCQTTMCRHLRIRSNSAHLLHSGGRKLLHANEDPTDPAKSTIPALAPGLFMHVDATKFDHRSSPISPEIISALPFGCPTLYVAVDSCTNKPIGRALLFGPQCRDGLAVLLRDILFRQFYLPRYLLADGGAEYIGPWFADFCLATGMSRFKPPAGDPAKNSPAENVLGRVNLLLSQRLMGSTEPDKAGRRIDNRYKSYNTACLLFKNIVAEIDEVLFGDIAVTPTANNIGSPEEKAEILRETFGRVGITRRYDDEFRILTSPIITQKISAIGTTGYRHEERMYRSPRLSELLRTGPAEEKRRDCVDPTIMYFKFGSEWIKAHSRDSIEMQTCGELDRLFRSLTGREVRSTNRCIRREISMARMDRVDRANAAAPANAHLPPSEPQLGPEDETKPFRIDDLIEITPFPVDDEEIA